MLTSPRAATSRPDAGKTMKAIFHHSYGPDGIELREVETPAIDDDQVLVRVHASSVNPVEWYGVNPMFFIRIMGGLRRPRKPNLGADLAGTVEAVGKDIQELRPGDDVFGSSGYSWAEYAPAREAKLARKPPNVSFEEAGTVAVAGLTALQAVRDHAKVQPGQKVLVNGASGGVGTFAVQIAKAFGADVTAVCSTRNVDQAGSLGADHVVDYTQQDFTRSGEHHDVMLDIAGSRPFLEFRRVLKPKAIVVAVGAPMSARGLGPLKHLVGSRLTSLGRSQSVVNFVAKITKEDLEVMRELLADGKVKSVIDRRFELEQVPDALRYLGEGHARGKVVITA
jgi:NADPH:quinone reductase-like Zn-dependent oxidoreductase